MSGKSVDEAFHGVLRRLQAANSLLVLTHARPDGDGLGSMVAFTRAARAAGRGAQMFLLDAVPRRYQFLFAGERTDPTEQFVSMADQADVIVILDTCALSQLGKIEEAIGRRRDRLVVVDHHATSDDLTTAQWIDISAAATGVMVGEIIQALNWPIDLAAAEALVTAAMSDTGWLQFANTDSRCLRAVAEWLQAGVRMDKLYKKLYQSDRPERLRLMVRMLQSLELHCNGRLAAMILRRPDFEQTGAVPAETENLINEALRIGSVETVVLLVENDHGVRVSLRSRDRVDVSAVAAHFGGGGHRRAAGIRSAEDLGILKQQVIEACAQELGRSEST